MVEDVRLAVNGKSEVFFYGRTGGAIMTPEEIYEELSTSPRFQAGAAVLKS